MKRCLLLPCTSDDGMCTGCNPDNPVALQGHQSAIARGPGLEASSYSFPGRTQCTACAQLWTVQRRA